MRASTVLVGAACALIASAAMAQERLPVRDARQLMLSALDAPDGKAHGILVGEVADAISKRFNATTPIYIDVSTEKRYAQPGCSRLNVRFWQDGVQLPNYGAGGVQAPRRQTIVPPAHVERARHPCDRVDQAQIRPPARRTQAKGPGLPPPGRPPDSKTGDSQRSPRHHRPEDCYGWPPWTPWHRHRQAFLPPP